MTSITDSQQTFGPSLPPEQTLAMPRHAVDEPSRPLGANALIGTARLGVFLARSWVLLMTLVLSYYGVTEMYAVLRTNTVTFLQWVFLVLFSVNFIWIAFAFAQASLGFLVCLSPWRRS